MGLTTKQAQHAKPGRHSDGRGLYLLVKPSGAKSWVLRVQHEGKRRDYGIGSFVAEPVETALPIYRRKSLTLAEAREKARIGRELAKAGENPASHWRVEQVVTPTFEQAAREYHRQVSKGWRNGKHGAQWLTTLENYAFGLIGNMTVDEIGASDVQKVLLPIWLSKSETARRVRQRVGVVLDYAHGKGWREAEAPIRAVNKLMGGIKQPKGRNFAAMPYADLPAFMQQLRTGESSVGRLALQFLILTAARSNEVRGATWREVDLEAGEWRIPAGRMKAGRLHIIPLVPAAAEILKLAKEQGRGRADEPVFPGLKRQPLSDATMSKVLRIAGGGDVTVHGFRSSFRDWAAETGFADAWAEAALAHGNPDKVEAAYKRTTYYAERRNKLMPAWASYVLGDASNVISLAEMRA
jgi:integrase